MNTATLEATQTPWLGSCTTEDANDQTATGPGRARYSIEELHERVCEAVEYFEAGGEGIPNEQVMQELDDFVELICD